MLKADAQYFVEIGIPQDSLLNKKFKRSAFRLFPCEIINVFTITFDLFNMSLLHKMIHFKNVKITCKLPKWL